MFQGGKFLGSVLISENYLIYEKLRIVVPNDFASSTSEQFRSSLRNIDFSDPYTYGSLAPTFSLRLLQEVQEQLEEQLLPVLKFEAYPNTKDSDKSNYINFFWYIYIILSLLDLFLQKCNISNIEFLPLVFLWVHNYQLLNTNM